jgi:hypothetical protein
MNAGRVNYGTWLLKLIAWDGALPIFIILVPTFVDLLFPNRRGAIEAAAVMVPIAAFFLRFFVGKRHINSNRCGRVIRKLQLVALCIGIFVLLMIDSLLILAHEMNRKAMFVAGADLIPLSIPFAIYLTLMAIALYPGKPEPPPVEWRDYDPFPEFGRGE